MRELQVEDVACPICLEILVAPVTLQCGHTFCAHCAQTWSRASGRKALCPVCRQQAAHSLTKNYLLAELLAIIFPRE
jgi:hypothetical protein